MEAFARLWTGLNGMDRPLVDRTGLKGTFDFIIMFSVKPPDSQPQPNPSGPSLPDALQEQLGLKLESRKEPVDVLVIDHLETPSEN